MADESGLTEVDEEEESGDLLLAPHERNWPRPWQAPFLRALSLLPDVTAACRVAGVSKQAAYKRRDANPEFGTAWDEALEMARDGLQSTAFSWARTGVPVRKKVTRTKTDKDGVVIETTVEETEGSERSATMAIFMLKAWFPERYRWSERHEHVGAGDGPIRVESLDAIDAQIAALSAELAARAGGAPVEAEGE